MNKIISTISILIMMLSVYSCREEENDLASIETNKITNENSVYGRTNDSIAVTDSVNAVAQPIPGDPPPKNGHQW